MSNSESLDQLDMSFEQMIRRSIILNYLLGPIINEGKT